MEMIKTTGFAELSAIEMNEVDGGIPVALGVALVALFGTGFAAGIDMGIKKWF